MIPRLPVSSPTTSLPTTRTTPIRTEPRATSSGRRPRAFTSSTLEGLLEHGRRRVELIFRAQRDQKIALLEAHVGARVNVHRAVDASQGQELRRLRAEQTGL